MEEQGRENFHVVRQFGEGGLNAYDDPADIQDNELADLRNIDFDSGLISPRKGSRKVANKPTGETGNPLMFADAETSDGLHYKVIVFGTNHYVFDDVNSVYVKINPGFTPTNSTTIYGWVNFNKNIKNDFLYYGNGADKTVKWPILIAHTTVALSGGESIVTVGDNSRFPASGTIIVNLTSGPQTLTYTSKTGTTVFNLSGTVPSAGVSGIFVTAQATQVTGMGQGTIFEVWQTRMFIANDHNGGENFVWISDQGNPEVNTGAGVSGGTSITSTDGEGGITMVKRIGNFLVIGKPNSLYSFNFNYDSTLNTKQVIISPLIDGQSIGPVNQNVHIQALQKLYYVTSTEGIIEATPVTTGTNISFQVKVISQKINPFVIDTLNFQNGRVEIFNNKLFFACSTKNTFKNDTVLVYDLLRDDWSIYSGWFVSFFHNDVTHLDFLSNVDGSYFDGLVDFQDDLGGYTSYALTKRFDFGEPAIPKGIDKIYLEGYIESNTALNIEVFYNEGGSLGKQSYTITGTDNFVVRPFSPALGQSMLGTQPLGWFLSDTTAVGFFRCYLDVSAAFGFYSLQMKFMSDQIGAQWSLVKLGFNVNREMSFPPELVISPS